MYALISVPRKMKVKKNQNQIKYLFLLQVYIGPINSTQYLHVKNRQ